MNPRVVGLCGYAQAGKDSVADVLDAEGWGRLALAEPLKRALYELNPLIYNNMGSQVRVQPFVDEVGWDVAKQMEEVRTLLQRMGTEVGRKVFWENFWVDLAGHRIQTALDLRQSVVVTDVRFVNEVELIKKFDGVMVRVTRPGIEALNTHASEVALDHAAVADFTIANDGDLADLKRKVFETLYTESVHA